MMIKEDVFNGYTVVITGANSGIGLEEISNAFNINESKIKKEIKNIEHIKNPKSDKSKKFLDLIKK